MAALGAPSDVVFILQVKVTINPKDKEAFLSHFKPVYDAVVAEPECAYFLFGEDLTAPGVFRFTEGWKKDVNWFMTVQMKKHYYEAYLKATEPMFIAERIGEVFAPLDGLNVVKLDSLKSLA